MVRTNPKTTRICFDQNQMTCSLNKTAKWYDIPFLFQKSRGIDHSFKQAPRFILNQRVGEKGEMERGSLRWSESTLGKANLHYKLHMFLVGGGRC